MKLQPLLSVIVANYNQARYLDECLKSILDQTCKDLEIVVYDDGSGDTSPAILQDFQKKFPGIIKVILDPVNRGVAQARHQAILAARGEYLTTLDSDDFFCNPQKLEKELALIQRVEKEEGKEIIAFSNVMLLKNDAPPCIWGTSKNIRQGMIACEILSRSCFIPRDFIMKREWYYQAGGYDARFKIYEDWDLKIRLAFQHEFRYAGCVGTAYRRHGRGLSSRPPSEHKQCLEQIFTKNIHLLKFYQRRRARKSLEAFIASLVKFQEQKK